MSILIYTSKKRFECMRLREFVNYLLMSLQGKYVPKYSKEKLMPVCNYCFKEIGLQGIYYPAEKLVFDSKECRDKMVSESGRIYCENKDRNNLVSLIEINILKQPKKGDSPPKKFIERTE